MIHFPFPGFHFSLHSLTPADFRFPINFPRGAPAQRCVFATFKAHFQGNEFNKRETTRRGRENGENVIAIVVICTVNDSLGLKAGCVNQQKS